MRRVKRHGQRVRARSAPKGRGKRPRPIRKGVPHRSRRKSEVRLMKKLTPEEYRVMRQCGTEPPFSGDLLLVKDDGSYACKACGKVLFDSKTKFDSGTGWPSFYNAVRGSVKLSEDLSLGEPRIEVTCSGCGSHLGHVFDDGPNPTGKRYCINSIALTFKGEKK